MINSIYSNEVLNYEGLTLKDKVTEAERANVIDHFSVFYYSPEDPFFKEFFYNSKEQDPYAAH